MIQTTASDELTGLLTRKNFREQLSELLAQSRSQELPLAIGLIDIDSFLLINETYGHQGGDETLKVVADTIRSLLGPDDLASRYGGDEFAVVFLNKEREPAFLRLEQLRQAVSQVELTTTGGKKVNGITISAGIAAFPVDGRTEPELVRKADQALYRAKMAGRNQVRLAYDEKMVPKTAHFTQTQLERLANLAEVHAVNEADLLREAVDDLLTKYGINDIES